MVFQGKGILMSSMQVQPEEEADFNRWFDQEHLPERVALPGFIEARRYASVATPTRYLQVYSAVDFEALDSPAYRAALGRQTAWSLHHIARFIAPTRVVGRLARSEGRARGAALLLVRLRPALGASVVPALQPYFGLADRVGVLSVHGVEGDAELSKPVMGDGPYIGGEDGYVLLECVDAEVAAALAGQLPPVPQGATLVETAVYRFRMDVSASSLAGWSLATGG